MANFYGNGWEGCDLNVIDNLLLGTHQAPSPALSAKRE
jgi:hypothetical protein